MIPLEVMTAVVGAVLGAVTATVGAAGLRRAAERRGARAAALLVAIELEANYGHLVAAHDLGDHLSHRGAEPDEVAALASKLASRAWSDQAATLARGIDAAGFCAVAQAYDTLGRLHVCESHPVWCQAGDKLATIESALDTLLTAARLDRKAPAAARRSADASQGSLQGRH